MITKSTFTFTIDWGTIFATLFLASFTFGFVWLANKYWAGYDPIIGLGVFYVVELYRRLAIENKYT